LKLKLDENLRQTGVILLRSAGHDVETVLDENLASAPDAEVLDAAVAEARCLVTLDTDFANPFVYPPKDTSGIVVIRARGKPKKSLVQACVRRLIDALRQGHVAGRLWIVEPDRIREYQSQPHEE
jgi:predicted nuclease of predicted toxin-antitoxin system